MGGRKVKYNIVRKGGKGRKEKLNIGEKVNKNRVEFGKRKRKNGGGDKEKTLEKLGRRGKEVKKGNFGRGARTKGRKDVGGEGRDSREEG
jgi:hypothetical protein